jgi:hypothetical protein
MLLSGTIIKAWATIAITLIIAAFVGTVRAQTVVDMTVATVSDGVRTELITLSDIRWQLALQPNTPLDPMLSEDLRRALDLLIDQRIFALEAERLPSPAPTEQEVAEEIKKLLSYFPSTSAFENRLRAVGFSSVRDSNFEDLISKRLAIEKYIDFRFRAFIVVTPEDELNYYNDIFVPDFRRRFPGMIMPTLAAARSEINEILREEREMAAIEAFLDEARRRAEIAILNEV